MKVPTRGNVVIPSTNRMLKTKTTRRRRDQSMEKKKSSDPTVATATKEASTKTKVNAIEHSAIPKQKDTDQQKKHSRSSKD